MVTVTAVEEEVQDLRFRGAKNDSTGAAAAQRRVITKAEYDASANYLFRDIPGISANPAGLLELPMAVVLGWYFREHFRWGLLIPMFIYYVWKECVPMSVVLHRYFSHKGFKCGRATQFALYCTGCLATQGPCLWWASKHRRHHKHCDTDKDPHSPVAFNSLYAWVGWAYLPSGDGPFGSGTDLEYIQDLATRFPELVAMEGLYFVPVWCAHALFYYFGGVAWAVYVSLWSGVLCQLLTLYFNVAYHEDDPKNEMQCKALNNPYDPLSQFFGEAYHLWHHQHPRAFHRPGVDAPYYLFIKPMLALGVFQGKNQMYETKLK